MIKVGLVKATRVNGLQTALIAVDAELSRRRPDNWAFLLVQVGDGAVLNVLPANVVYPQRANMTCKVRRRDLGQRRQEQRVDQESIQTKRCRHSNGHNGNAESHRVLNGKEGLEHCWWLGRGRLSTVEQVVVCCFSLNSAESF